MVNTTAKGNAIELLAQRMLEAMGYKVQRFYRTTQWHPKKGQNNAGAKTKKDFSNHGNDGYGIVDMIAKKSGERTRWVQVSASNKKGKVKKGFEDADCFGVEHDSCEYWRWVGGRGNMYFQLYFMDDDFELNKENTIYKKDWIKE